MTVFHSLYRRADCRKKNLVGSLFINISTTPKTSYQHANCLPHSYCPDLSPTSLLLTNSHHLSQALEEHEQMIQTSEQLATIDQQLCGITYEAMSAKNEHLAEELEVKKESEGRLVKRVNDLEYMLRSRDREIEELRQREKELQSDVCGLSNEIECLKEDAVEFGVTEQDLNDEIQRLQSVVDSMDEQVMTLTTTLMQERREADHLRHLLESESGRLQADSLKEAVMESISQYLDRDAIELPVVHECQCSDEEFEHAHERRRRPFNQEADEAEEEEEEDEEEEDEEEEDGEEEDGEEEENEEEEEEEDEEDGLISWSRDELKAQQGEVVSMFDHMQEKEVDRVASPRAGGSTPLPEDFNNGWCDEDEEEEEQDQDEVAEEEEDEDGDKVERVLEELEELEAEHVEAQQAAQDAEDGQLNVGVIEEQNGNHVASEANRGGGHTTQLKQAASLQSPIRSPASNSIAPSKFFCFTQPIRRRSRGRCHQPLPKSIENSEAFSTERPQFSSTMPKSRVLDSKHYTFSSTWRSQHPQSPSNTLSGRSTFSMTGGFGQRPRTPMTTSPTHSHDDVKHRKVNKFKLDDLFDKESEHHPSFARQGALSTSIRFH